MPYKNCALLQTEKKSKLRYGLLFFFLRDLVPVARVTFKRRRLVEDDRLVADESHGGVTLVTLHVRVAASQRHLGSLVVVER